METTDNNRERLLADLHIAKAEANTLRAALHRAERDGTDNDDIGEIEDELSAADDKLEEADEALDLFDQNK